MPATDRLDLLRLFVLIAESSTISDAAENLGISQPSASRLLKRLEETLHQQLLQRTGSGVKLTRSGDDLLRAARRILQQWDSLTARAASQRQLLAGRIRVAAPVAAGQGLLAAAVAKFLAKYPKVTVDFELRDDQLDLNSTADDYDFWVRIGSIRSDKLVVREIAAVRRGIFCVPALGAALHPRELQHVKAIRLTPFVPETTVLSHEDGNTFRLKQICALNTNNLYAARAAAIGGIGYAILPLWVTESDVLAGHLVQACPAWAPEPLLLSIAYPPGRKRPARVIALADHLKDELSNIASARNTMLDHLLTLESSTLPAIDAL